MRWFRFLIIGLVALLAVTTLTTSAQDGNLLQDPGFEGAYVARGRPDLNTAAPWGLWSVDSPRNYEWQNRSDRLFAFPHPAPPEIHSGTKSQNLNGGYVTYTAAVYQTVTVPNRANLVGSAWAWVHTCNIAKDASGNFIADNCGSAVESGVYVRVGIDPNGGTNPYDPAVVWSNNIQPHQRWEQATVSATANGTSATLFIFVTQAWPADINRAYFDDASLTVGGAGGAAAPVPGVPTAVPTPATASFVVAQPPQADGSIRHLIMPGDTMAAIGYAYGVTIDEIMALNPQLRSPRFISVGQYLLIQEADAEGASSAEGAAPAGVAPRAIISDEDLFRGGDGYLNGSPGPTPVGMS
ncbi:MAG: LysM peptidoglycan-binding domain-containing protein [Chloroflexi bacterium]|uniref:LysM peptidoglycan-binding domain-containing protein n=1 Tax=Candidatus Flexifilum breve TaxID=3140694 RepID=UPI0031366F64|nr:LysM peptidoglycan-binding domain-containing protein [Chloroflexota bacterium]